MSNTNDVGVAKRGRVETAVNGVVSSLSAMQRTFVIEYLLHGNATKAAEVAGYKHPDKQGPRLRHDEKIQAAIDEYFYAQEMSAGEVVARLSEQAKAAYGAYLRWDSEAKEVYCDLESLLADGLGHLIKKIGYDRTGADSAVQVVEFYDAHTALVDVGRYHSLFGAKGTEEDPVHNKTVGLTLDEWKAEQAQRRAEVEVSSAETLSIFEEELADAPPAD